MCGAANCTFSPMLSSRGLSPRVRGSHGVEDAPIACPRSIPTCAGQPLTPVPPISHPRVYPHVCGAAKDCPGCPDCELGLSPRVRGSRYPEVIMGHRLGSIPTCAGQPSPVPCRRSFIRVYPHVCGAAPVCRREHNVNEGLSPRVRGSLFHNLGIRRIIRSIPTCAGQPCTGTGRSSPARVYPHVCGAAGIPARTNHRNEGLSPRVRGSLFSGHT